MIREFAPAESPKALFVPFNITPINPFIILVNSTHSAGASSFNRKYIMLLKIQENICSNSLIVKGYKSFLCFFFFVKLEIKDVFLVCKVE